MPLIHVRPASAFVVLAEGADGVYVRVGGCEVGPVPAAASDASTAADVASAVNGHPEMSALVVASHANSVVMLTAIAPGSGGNGMALDVESVSAGAAIPTGSCLSGGVSVTFSF